MSTATRPVTRGVADRLGALATELLGADLPVRLRAWDGSEFGPHDAPVLVLRDKTALRRLLWQPGELGLAQAYVSGEIDVNGDLAEGLRRVWRQVRAGGSGSGSGSGRLTAGQRLRAIRLGASLGVFGSRPAAPTVQAKLSGTVHSRERDRAAITYHYDLSNDFYRLILDPNMAYSCAYWTSTEPGYTLEQAQTDKLDLICRKLGLRAGMRMLDVGCGWGSLTVHAARHYGVRVTAVTLAGQQRAFVADRVAGLGLAELVDVRLQDYRDVTDEPFDAIATVEMGEHVGAANYPVFAGRLHALLRPEGRLLVQQMSRPKGSSSPGGGPFIESYVAPDMHMRPVGQTVDLLESAGLEVRDVHAMREHYVWTALAWLDTLEAHWDEVVALVGEPMARVWRLYLVGGALTFEERRMGVDQILAVRPTAIGDSGMPRRDPELEMTMPDLGPLLLNLALALGAALVVVLIAFTIGVATGKHRTIDVFWGLGFAAVAVTTLVASAGDGNDARRWVITALTVIWGVRLATHIAWRGRGEPEDPRYDAMLSRATGNRNLYALRMVYLLQGLSLWFISLPIQVGQYDPDALTWVSYVGIAVFAVGLFFESVGDAQLASFKANPANKGTVMDRGLWHYTRHPNYFGDACVWWGLWLLAADSWLGLATIVCPLVMNYLLLRKTGKPLLEARLSTTRPGYAEYVARTSGFIPLPPRRS